MKKLFYCSLFLGVIAMVSCSKPAKNIPMDHFAGVIACYTTPVSFFDYATETWHPVSENAACADILGRYAELGARSDSNAYISFHGHIVDSASARVMVIDTLLKFEPAPYFDHQRVLTSYYLSAVNRLSLQLNDDYTYIQIQGYEDGAPYDTMTGRWGMASDMVVVLQQEIPAGKGQASFTFAPNVANSLISNDPTRKDFVFTPVEKLEE